MKLVADEPGAKLPAYQTLGSAGADLHALLYKPLPIPPGSRSLVRTGVRVVDMRECDCLLVLPRSGLAKDGLSVVTGLIDSDYEGEVLVLVHNISSMEHTIHPGERIAQLLYCPIQRIPGLEVGGDRNGGHGSTGR